MKRQIKSALLSVFSKRGLEPIVHLLHQQGVKLYSTGGTKKFIDELGIPSIAVEEVTGFPSILGGRVKTLHPKIFGGILNRREDQGDQQQVSEHSIPNIDLVIVDLYPFQETLEHTDDEAEIIEKIDIGGVSLIRAAAKNFKDVCVVSSRDHYDDLMQILEEGAGESSLGERKRLAALAFDECAGYDSDIADWMEEMVNQESKAEGGPEAESLFEEDKDDLQVGEDEDQDSSEDDDQSIVLRYGENPHQKASFHGELDEIFTQLNGKALSYNNLVDADAACRLMQEFKEPAFAVIKHTNVCGFALADSVDIAWQKALAGDAESAFGGVLITNQEVSMAVAEQINDIFFEILIAPAFEADALSLLKGKKNRILLQQKEDVVSDVDMKNVLNGMLVQERDVDDFEKWEDVGAQNASAEESNDLSLANILCKHLKSNAIVLVKNGQMIGKGCGQTSRIDALRHALAKAAQFEFSTHSAVMASDAFFPFDDCVRIAQEAGISAVIQPGGSIRDADTINFCKANHMAMVLTGMRHFRH